MEDIIDNSRTTLSLNSKISILFSNTISLLLHAFAICSVMNFCETNKLSYIIVGLSILFVSILATILFPQVINIIQKLRIKHIKNHLFLIFCALLSSISFILFATNCLYIQSAKIFSICIYCFMYMIFIIFLEVYSYCINTITTKMLDNDIEKESFQEISVYFVFIAIAFSLVILFLLESRLFGVNKSLGYIDIFIICSIVYLISSIWVFASTIKNIPRIYLLESKAKLIEKINFKGLIVKESENSLFLLLSRIFTFVLWFFTCYCILFINKTSLKIDDILRLLMIVLYLLINFGGTYLFRKCIIQISVNKIKAISMIASVIVLITIILNNIFFRHLNGNQLTLYFVIYTIIFAFIGALIFSITNFGIKQFFYNSISKNSNASFIFHKIIQIFTFALVLFLLCVVNDLFNISKNQETSLMLTFYVMSGLIFLLSSLAIIIQDNKKTNSK